MKYLSIPSRDLLAGRNRHSDSRFLAHSRKHRAVKARLIREVRNAARSACGEMQLSEKFASAAGGRV